MSSGSKLLARVATCIAASLALGILVTACGDGETKTGSGGTGAVPTASDIIASGPLNALGPVGVGSVGLSDTSASFFINAQDGRAVTELRLGMLIEASGSIITGNTGTLSRLTAQSAVIGPVGAIDVAAQRLTVLSVSVQMDQNTILDGFTSLAALAAEDRVEVYGLPLPTAGAVLATRVIKRPAGDKTVELLGIANGVAAGLVAGRFSVQGVTVAAVGMATIVVAPVSQAMPPSIAAIPENSRVRVIGTYDPATNTITATRLVSGLAPVRPDDNVVVLDGLVQSVVRPGQFRVNDTDVESTDAAMVTLTPGTHVRVRGRMRQTSLVASEFRLIAANERIEYVVQGPVADFVSSMDFKVRGEAINAGTATFSGGAPALLVNGKQVRVKVIAGPGQLTATEVTFLQ